MAISLARALAIPTTHTDQRGMIATDGWLTGKAGRLLRLAMAEVVEANLGAPGNTPAKVASVLKSQDEKGVWHFSDNEVEGRGVRKITVVPDANVVYFSASENSQAQSALMSGSSGDNHSATSAVASIAPVGAIIGLIGNSKNVATLQKEHVARQERALQ